MKGFEEESLGSADEEKDATESVERDTAAPVEPAAHEDEAPVEPAAHEESAPAEPAAHEAEASAEPAAHQAQAPTEPAAHEASAPAGFHRTRESLEGAVVNPVPMSDEESAHLATGAVGVSPSVKRAGRERTILDALGSGFDDLEPRTRASARAAGTARFMGDAPKAAADEPSAKGGEDPEKDASGLGSEKGATDPGSEGDAKAPASDPQPARRRMPLPAKVLIVLLVLLFAAAALAWAWVSGIERSMSVSEEDRADLEAALTEPAQEESEAFYALIIGSDAREGDGISRSDVIMLARVDAANSCVTLVSIPRDTMIGRDDGSVEKINATYNYGPGSTVREVSEFAGVDIAHYVEVDFEGLEEVVDALGGVTVNIPEDIPAGNGGLSFSAGEQTLNGEQALAYARERYNVSGGDFGRAQAQRQIVGAIVSQVLASSPTDMPFLVTKLAESISTDLSVADIISYALDLQGAEGGLTIYSAAAPSYALDRGGVSYAATMYDEWRAMMRRVDAGLDPNDESAEIPEEQLEDERLGAATNAAGPRDYEDLAESSLLTTDDVA